MRRVGFTLIELLIVILIIGMVSFLVIKFPSFSISFKIENLKDYLYPNGEFYVFDDGREIVLKNRRLKDIKSKEELEEIIKKNKIKILFNSVEVYVYDGEFKKKNFSYFLGKKIIFKYRVKNGIGESFILKNNGKWYVFKPFYIKKASTFKDAENEFLLKEFMPDTGEYF